MSPIPTFDADLFTRTRRRLDEVQAEIASACAACGRAADGVRLIGVTKSAREAQLAALQRAGLRDFAESRVQQLVPRVELTRALAIAENQPPQVWHLIGHLQTNKVKPVVGAVDVIHSLDSLRLAQEIDQRAGQLAPARCLNGLIEVNVSGEESKHGVRPDEVQGLAEALQGLTHLRLVGLMTMAPYCEPNDVPRVAGPVFAELRRLRDEVRTRLGLETFAELSMGMSGDFVEAIKHGATMVRIGTRLLEETTDERR